MQRSARLARRMFVVGGAATFCLSAFTAAVARGALPDPECPRCWGVGRIPLANAKPFVWTLGSSLPKPASIVGEQFCPECQADADSKLLAEKIKQQIDAAIEKHKQWEERTGWNLVCVVTRHATIHSQLTVGQTRQIGTAVEGLLDKLKPLTGTLVMSSTRPDSLELMHLWEKSSWDKFRKVMEGLFTTQQLGPTWAAAAEHNAFDHVAIAHTYETQQTLRTRPPPCGAVFICGRRQINLATNWRAPFWLAEGFSAYCDYAVHKLNRWFTTYQVKPVTPGDWMAVASKLAGEGKSRPWKQMRERDETIWDTNDHAQTMAMTAFLLEGAPARFLELLKRLKKGEQDDFALEEAYRLTTDELEERYTRWMLSRK